MIFNIVFSFLFSVKSRFITIFIFEFYGFFLKERMIKTIFIRLTYFFGGKATRR